MYYQIYGWICEQNYENIMKIKDNVEEYKPKGIIYQTFDQWLKLNKFSSGLAIGQAYKYASDTCKMLERNEFMFPCSKDELVKMYTRKLLYCNYCGDMFLMYIRSLMYWHIHQALEKELNTDIINLICLKVVALNEH